MSLDRSVTPGQQSRVSIIPPLSTRASVTRAPARAAAERESSGTQVLVAGWCCSVGATWTVVLHEVGSDTTVGTLVNWISSGVPTFQSEPDEAVARKLLADRGLHLYPDSGAGPCTPSRHSIGYVSGDTEVIRLAHRIRAAATAAGVHPVLLAAQRIATRCGVQAGSAEA